MQSIARLLVRPEHWYFTSRKKPIMFKRSEATSANLQSAAESVPAEQQEQNPKADLGEPEPVSERMAQFQRKLRENKDKLREFSPYSPEERELLKPWPNGVNPHTGEIDGPKGPEPTRYGDWQHRGRVTDF